MAPSALPVPPDLPLALRLHGLQRRYGMALRFSKGDHTVKVHYEADVACPAAAAGPFLLEVRKHQVYINDQLPERVMDLLADACGKPLYPVVFEGGAGATLRRVTNGAEIRRRWAEAVPALETYYTGDVSEDILNAMSRAVASDVRLFDTLRRDWLLVLLFAPLFHAYKGYEAEADFYLPVISYRQPVRYRATMTVLPSYSESGLLVIDCQGPCTDPRPLRDILKGNAVPVAGSNGVPVAGTMALRFKMHPGNGTIFSAEGQCSLTLPDGGERRIEIELFQLDPIESESVPARGSGTSLLLEEEQQEPKRTGWRALFG